jgi:hypothetical protein
VVGIVSTPLATVPLAGNPDHDTLPVPSNGSDKPTKLVAVLGVVVVPMVVVIAAGRLALVLPEPNSESDELRLTCVAAPLASAVVEAEFPDDEFFPDGTESSAVDDTSRLWEWVSA